MLKIFSQNFQNLVPQATRVQRFTAPLRISGFVIRSLISNGIDISHVHVMHHPQVRLAVVTPFEAFAANGTLEFGDHTVALVVLMPDHRIPPVVRFRAAGALEK